MLEELSQRWMSLRKKLLRQKKFLEETNMRVEKVGEALKEHAKKIRQK